MDEVEDADGERLRSAREVLRSSRVSGGCPGGDGGGIFTGGEGEGLFAVTYRMTGELDDPNVDVNVLAALAPGFLRALFSGSGSRGDAADQPRALPERIER